MAPYCEKCARRIASFLYSAEHVNKALPWQRLLILLHGRITERGCYSLLLLGLRLLLFLGYCYCYLGYWLLLLGYCYF